jgi:hypothetical protein
LVYKSRC